MDVIVCLRGGRLQRAVVGGVFLDHRRGQISAVVPAVCMDGDEFDYSLPGKKLSGRFRGPEQTVRRRGCPRLFRKPSARQRRPGNGGGGIGPGFLVCPLPLSPPDLPAALKYLAKALSAVRALRSPRL